MLFRMPRIHLIPLYVVTHRLRWRISSEKSLISPTAASARIFPAPLAYRLRPRLSEKNASSFAASYFRLEYFEYLIRIAIRISSTHSHASDIVCAGGFLDLPKSRKI